MLSGALGEPLARTRVGTLKMSKRGAELDLRRHMDAGDEETEDAGEHESQSQNVDLSQRE